MAILKTGARALTSVLLSFLLVGSAVAQVNKAILGHSNNRDSGYVQLRGNTDETIVYLGSIDDSGDDRDLGNLQLKDGTGASGITRAQLYLPSGRGILKLEDLDDDLRVDLRSSLRDYGSGSNESYGLLRLYGGTAENEIVFLGGSNSSPRQGQLKLRHSDDGLTRVHAFVDGDKNGVLRLYNSAQSVRSVQLSAAGEGGTVRVRSESNTTVGTLRAVQENGEECGQLYLTSTGGNAVLIDGCQGVKNAVINHPEKSGKQIFYAAMEGPEVGVYARGRAELEGGKAKVRFPSHFSAIVASEGITVQLTPHSAASLGLAALKVSGRGMEVVELGGDAGRGSYEFSYYVQGIKKGSEKYPVVRDAISFGKEDDGKPQDKEDSERPEPGTDDESTIDIEDKPAD